MVRGEESVTNLNRTVMMTSSLHHTHLERKGMVNESETNPKQDNNDDIIITSHSPGRWEGGCGKGMR